MTYYDYKPCTCTLCVGAKKPLLSGGRAILAILALAVALLGIFVLSGCGRKGSEGPTSPSPVVDTPAVAPAPTAVAPAPAAAPLAPRDYLTIQSKSQTETTSTVVVRNKDNGESYVVHSCQYTPGGDEGVLIDQDQATVPPGGTITLRVKKPKCGGLTWQNDVALQVCSDTPVFAGGMFLGYATGVTDKCDPPPPPKCNDKVTTITAGHLTIYVSNAGNYSINGGALFPLGANSTTTLDYPVDGSKITLTTPDDRRFTMTTYARCSDEGASWHGTMTFSCTTTVHHSCPQQ